MNDLRFLRVLHKTRTHSTHTLTFGGKIIACPAADWQATVGEKLFTKTTRFVFLSILLYFFLRSVTTSSPLKAKRNTWSIAEEKDILLLCKEKAIADLLHKCVDRLVWVDPFNFKLSLYIYLSNCYLRIINLHLKSKSRTEIRRKPFIRAVFVLDKTCSLV